MQAAGLDVSAALTDNAGNRVSRLLACISRISKRDELLDRILEYVAIVTHRQHLPARCPAGLYAPRPSRDLHLAGWGHDVVTVQPQRLGDWFREWLATGDAFGRRQVIDLLTVVADLDRRVAAALFAARIDLRDRAMRRHQTSEVQHQTVVAVALDPHPASGHLDIEADR